MVARTSLQSITGATLGLSATLPATYDEAGYTASVMEFTNVGKMENWGNHGVVANVATFKDVETGTVEKIKGSKDYGTMNMTVGSIPTDAGQILLLAASESNLHYSAVLTYPDGEEHYLDVLVSKHEFQDGGADDLSKVGVDIAICRQPIIVDAPA